MRRGIIYQVPFGDPLGSDIGPGDTTSIFTALVNGIGFVPDAVVPIAVNDRLTINATNKDQEFITLSVPTDVQIGTYDINSTGLYKASYKVGGNSAQEAISGTLEITGVDNTVPNVQGTFNFTTGAPGNVEVTQGVFDIEY